MDSKQKVYSQILGHDGSISQYFTQITYTLMYNNNNNNKHTCPH